MGILSRGFGDVVWRVWARCWQGVQRLSGRCEEDVRRVQRHCLEVFGGCLGGCRYAVWRVYGV